MKSKNLNKNSAIKTLFLLIVFSLTLSNTGFAQKAAKALSTVKEADVRAAMYSLASDAMRGRGSGTIDEMRAAEYIGSQLKKFGVLPAGEKNASGKITYLQTVKIGRNSFDEAPKLTYSANGSTVILENGKDFLVARMNAAEIAGKLQKINLDETPQKSAVVFIRLRESDDAQSVNRKLQTILSAGAKAIIVEETPQIRAQWQTIAARRIAFTTINGTATGDANVFYISKNAADALSQIADGANIEIKGKLAVPQTQQTWNAVGMIPGADAKSKSEVILLSAHLDHLGVRENAPGDDKIFNGADDDASGCIAVMELARALKKGARPKRTVYFAFFGSEESGGFGARYFVDNLPFPKEKLVANLEFEMIGRPDALVAADELWLTGYERSNLGAELAKQGARLVADPHPDQNFFQRSDNYTLARQGIIAHTVSSFGLHTDYHHASDEIKTIDFDHMTRAVNSMVAPVRWLVNSDFKPEWYEGKKP